MLAKKKSNLEIGNYKFVFFSIGLMFSLLFINVILEWETVTENDTEIVLAGTQVETEEIQDIPPTEIPPPPLPPMHTAMQNPEIIEVDDEEVLEELNVNFDVEITAEAPKPQGTGLKNEGAFNPNVIATPPAPPKKEVEDKIFIVAEEQPIPIGGMDAFYKYVQSELKYPKQARRNKVSGRVYLEFIVDKDGSLGHFKVLKGIGFGCDEEAIRVLDNAPKWQPGKQRGKKVRVKMNVPVIFVLK